MKYEIEIDESLLEGMVPVAFREAIASDKTVIGPGGKICSAEELAPGSYRLILVPKPAAKPTFEPGTYVRGANGFVYQVIRKEDSRCPQDDPDEVYVELPNGYHQHGRRDYFSPWTPRPGERVYANGHFGRFDMRSDDGKHYVLWDRQSVPPPTQCAHPEKLIPADFAPKPEPPKSQHPVLPDGWMLREPRRQSLCIADSYLDNDGSIQCCVRSGDPAGEYWIISPKLAAPPFPPRDMTPELVIELRKATAAVESLTEVMRKAVAGK